MAQSGPSSLLFLSGELRQPGLVRALARRVDAVVCADGGTRHARALKLVPNAVVGDMDSFRRRIPRAWRQTQFIRDPDENRSDLDKALDWAESAGARRVWIAGALGGRLDHELVNLAALEARRGPAELIVVGGGIARLLGPGRYRPGLSRGERFSLIAAPRARLTVTGARYPLRDAVLSRGTRGLGNRAEGTVVLDVHVGRVWLAVDTLRF